MIDFKRLVRDKPAIDLTDPLQLFGSLDRRTTHSVLRPAQEAALNALKERWTERDSVLKMPTGTGKTTVGLLYLAAHMAAKKRPAVYLCPTKQLVQQVLEEARRLGLAAHAYKAGEQQPNPQCAAGEAVIVCTYDKLFNAKSTFDRNEVRFTASALLLDDAHAGVEDVREQFTLRCTDGELLAALFSVIDAACRTYQPGLWEDIKTGRPGTIVEIPYWLWATLLPEVTQAVAKHHDLPDVTFKWPFVHPVLRWCRCLVAKSAVEIVPDVLPVSAVRTFETAEHRLFMSATLADDAVIVRELGCDSLAAAQPVIAGAEAGLGERMVLVPSLIHPRLDRNWILDWAAKKSATARTVVLASSEQDTRAWSAAGAVVALGPDVTDTVGKLQKGEVQFAAFAQRYDGIDLPDDACRVLILDGMPKGQGVTDTYDSSRPGVHAGIRDRFAYRIEHPGGHLKSGHHVDGQNRPPRRWRSRRSRFTA